MIPAERRIVNPNVAKYRDADAYAYLCCSMRNIPKKDPENLWAKLKGLLNKFAPSPDTRCENSASANVRFKQR